MTPLNLPDLKFENAGLVRHVGSMCYFTRIIANCMLKFANFRYHSNNFNDTIKLFDPEYPLFGVSCVSRVLVNFYSSRATFLT